MPSIEDIKKIVNRFRPRGSSNRKEDVGVDVQMTARVYDEDGNLKEEQKFKPEDK